MQQPCGTFQVGNAKSGLWALIPVTARGAEYFLMQAAPDNADIVSISGNIIAPGERRVMHVDQMRTASLCGPDPACAVQVWVVTE